MPQTLRKKKLLELQSHNLLAPTFDHNFYKNVGIFITGAYRAECAQDSKHFNEVNGELWNKEHEVKNG